MKLNWYKLFEQQRTREMMFFWLRDISGILFSFLHFETFAFAKHA